MLPSPAWPKHGISSRCRARTRLDQVEQLRHAAARHDEVVIDLARRSARSANDSSRRASQMRVALCLSRSRARTIERAGRAAGRDHARGLFLDAARHAVHLDDQHRAGARRARRARLRCALDGRQRHIDRSSSIVAGTTRAASSRETASTAPSMSANVGLQRRLHRRLRHQPQRDLGDDGQRAFRADQQLREVVADDVLHRLRTGADDLAGRQHGFERQHVALGRAVLHRARPAGALRDVAADATTASGWRDPADRTGRALRPRPADRRVMTLGWTTARRFVFVDLEDAVEPLHRERRRRRGRARRRRCSPCRRRARPAARDARCTARAMAATLGVSCRAAARDRPDGRSAARRCRSARRSGRISARVTPSPTMATSDAMEIGGHSSTPACAAQRRAPDVGPSAAALAPAHELVDARHAFAQPIERRRVEKPEEAGRVEALARRDRHVRFVEQRLGELRRRAHARRLERVGGVREEVERAARLDAGEPRILASATPRPGRAAAGIRRSIVVTLSCGPVSAASAAFCVIDETFDVECPWRH